MTINGVEIPLGETGSVEVNIARLPSRTHIDIIVTVARAVEPGPVLLLMGGLHGDEINGVEIVRRIIEENIHIPERGTVICIPIINIYGFINFSRNVPDGKDVNRSFPGNHSGSLASRIAWYLMKDIIPQIDFGIDFHTGGANKENYPQVRCLLDDPVNRELAEAFHAPVTLHSTYRPKSLRQSAARLGKKILVYEGGESSRLSEEAISHGIAGTRRLMGHLGMVPPVEGHPGYETSVFMRSSWIRARTSGIFRSLVSCGDEISKNQPVGSITDPFGEFRVQVKSPSAGRVISLNNNPILHQGDAVVHLGIPGDGH
jgi:predicted deacylase